jgi:hypothetical protein
MLQNPAALQLDMHSGMHHVQHDQQGCAFPGSVVDRVPCVLQGRLNVRRALLALGKACEYWQHVARTGG